MIGIVMNKIRTAWNIWLEERRFMLWISLVDLDESVSDFLFLERRQIVRHNWLFDSEASRRFSMISDLKF
jgi:hypothetical protein